MAVFIGNISALAILRDHASRKGPQLPVARAEQLSQNALEISSTLSGCPPEAFVDGKVHIVVPGHTARCKKSICVSHIWSAPIIRGSFYTLGDGIYLSTPEFLFLQMAASLSLEALVELGAELCGTYAINRRYARGFVTPTEPLSSVASINRYIQRSEGCYGVDKARTAARFLFDDSNSPMETAFGMLLHLPRARGGENLSGFELNREFDLSPEWQRRLGVHSFKPDFYFSKTRTAVEYYGNDHDAITAKEYDATRHALMEYLGIRVLGVTKAQLYQPDKYMGMLKELYKLLGRTYRRPTPEQQIATLLLKDRILPGHDSSRYLGTFLY